MRRKWIVYTVTFFKAGHRLDGVVRYVGQTQRTIQARWKNHIAKATAGVPTALGACIRKYGPDHFVVAQLSEHDTQEAASAAEVAAIARLGTLASGRRGGLNLSRGGDAVDFDNPAIRAKHRAAVRAACNTPAARALSSERLRETRRKNPDVFAEASRSNWRDPELRQRMLANHDPAHIAAIGRANAERHADPNYRERHREIARLGGIASRRATILRNQDPTFISSQRARLAEIRSSPEFKVKVQLGQFRRRAREAREVGDEVKARLYDERIARLTTITQPRPEDIAGG